MAYERIIGHQIPWNSISLRRPTALWIRPLGQRLGVGTRAVSQPSDDLCGVYLFGASFYQCLGVPINK